MIRDITIGQYYPVDSLIHRLDPRVKLFATMIYVISLFLYKGVAGLLLITMGLVGVVLLSKVPFRYMVKGLKAILILILMTVIFNLFMTPGANVYWQWKFLKITDIGVQNALVITIRLIYLILGTSLMTLTTTPNQLTDALEKSLKPLNRIKIPVHTIAMMMSIALRFIPIFLEETDKIMKAQMARGADFETGTILQRARNMIPLLVPLFVSAFRRADDLAMAMEARCYQGGEGRTQMKPLRYEKRDRMAYLLVVIYMVGVVLLRIYV